MHDPCCSTWRLCSTWNPAGKRPTLCLPSAMTLSTIPFFTSIGADIEPTGNLLFSAGKLGREKVGVAGSSYYSIRQGFVSGDALAIHTVTRGPGILATIETEVRPAGKLRKATATYAFPGHHRGGRLVAAEWKLITAGGFYNRVSDYVDFVRDAAATLSRQQAALDLSISYDYGVTINAFAKCFAVCASGDVIPQLPHWRMNCGLFSTCISNFISTFTSMSIRDSRIRSSLAN